jgi:hypothetical protein
MDKQTISLISEFYKKIENKKRVVFGAGPTAEEFMKNFEVNPIYIVDNDQTLWDTSFFGSSVKQPKSLIKEDRGNIVVIIANIDIQDTLMQLKNYGFDEDENILISPLLITEQEQFYRNLPGLLVSCTGFNGGIYHIEFNDDPIVKNVYSGDCRGLAQEEDYIYVAEEHNGIVKLDLEYNVVKKNKTPESFNLHGIDTDSSRNVIYVNETKFDRIGVYDNLTLKKNDEITFVKFNNENNDQHHINDIKYFNNKLYVMMFSLNGVWQNHVWNDGGILRIDVKTKEIEKKIISGLRQPHSLLLDKNDIYYCNSSERKIYHGDKILCQFSGYTRGLAKWNEYFLVGQSKSRRLSAIRENFTNISMDTGLHIWNSTIKTSNFINIPAENVFDILIR